MLESLTIFNPGGLVYYQYITESSLFHKRKQEQIAAFATTASSTNENTATSFETKNLFHNACINQSLIKKILLHPTAANGTNDAFIDQGLTFVWMLSNDEKFYIVAVYPDIIFEGPRFYLKMWAEELINEVYKEYIIFYNAEFYKFKNNDDSNSTNGKDVNHENDPNNDFLLFVRPDPNLFNNTFQLILHNSKTKGNNQAFDENDSSNNNDDEVEMLIKHYKTTGTLLLPTTNTNHNDHNVASAHLPQHLQPSSISMSLSAPDPVRTIDAGTAACIGSTNENKNVKKATKNNKKTMRNWHDGKNKVSDKAMAELDRNKEDGGTAQEGYERALREARLAYLPTNQDLTEETMVLSTNSSSNENKKKNPTTSTPPSYFSSLFAFAQDRVLTEQDLQQPCSKIGTMLKSKNVASTIANEIITAIQKELIGKRIKALYTIDTAIKQALQTTLTRIMHHNKNYDLLRNVLTRQHERKSNLLSNVMSFSTKKRPYVIAVMGINGIGKTTTIAKLAYYFVQNKCQPLLVACDTFRSGAVEQLKIHADCLNVPFFTQGYSKDPSSVATAAITAATTMNFSNSSNNSTNTAVSSSTTTTTPIDVVLIDTAGRMQNNVPLMKALNKLIVENRPDCCILVCEALVGHDGLNQYELFSKAAATSTKSKGIDGLILTKFDTVDTKIGASVSLTYETATPILFVGTGQKYHHLSKLSIDTIVDNLFQ